MKSKSILLCIIVIPVFIITSCSTGYSVNEAESVEKLTVDIIDQLDHSESYSSRNTVLKLGSIEPENTDNIKQDPEDKPAVPNKSGETTSVPWENDEKFRDAQEKYECTEFMAGYRTVLHDPLPGEEDNVHLAARLLAGTVVKPGETFSQNTRIGPYTRSRGFKDGPTYMGTKLITTTGGGVCKIASTLYNVAILANLPIMERHCHNMPVPYVPYGQDATVAYGVKDFRFKNNTSFPILIWAQGVGSTLYIGFYGETKPPKVQWHHEMLKVYQAEKVYRTNPELPAGTEKIILEGMDGGVVRSWLTIENPDGTQTVKQLGKSYYNPMAYIVEKGK